MITDDFLNPHICRICTIPHVDNCPDCFGFGFDYDGNLIRAGLALLWPKDKPYQACSTCGGTPTNEHLKEPAHE